MIQECLIEITKLAFDDKPKNPSAVNLISGLLAPESEKIREALKAAGIPLGDGNAGADRSVEHLIFGQDPISTGEHHEMLLFIAVKMHWRAATGRCNGFNNRIRPICICAGKPHCNTFHRKQNAKVPPDASRS